MQKDLNHKIPDQSGEKTHDTGIPHVIGYVQLLRREISLVTHIRTTEVYMSNNLWQRLGAASGILYVGLLLGPQVILRGLEEEPALTTAEAIAHACATTTAAQFTDGIIPILHGLA